MTEIYAYTITRANTAARARLLLETITQARETAGVDFYWQVFCQLGTMAKEVCNNAFDLGLINNVMFYHDNVGQHVATNDAIQAATSQEAKYLLRLDDDVEFKTKQWLKKLLEASVLLEDKMIISPVVRGLTNQPQRSEPCTVNTVELEFLVDAIGGICRLHPMSVICAEKDPYVSDVRLALGAGDATGIAAWCKKNTIPMAYIRTINVRHAKGTKGQIESDPIYHGLHDLFQHIPYIPTWGPSDDQVSR